MRDGLVAWLDRWASQLDRSVTFLCGKLGLHESRLREWRSRVGQKTKGTPLGAAVLEYRLRYHRMPRAGDMFVVHSSFGGVHGKTHSLVHWIMDPETGGPWATSQASSVPGT